VRIIGSRQITLFQAITPFRTVGVKLLI
jgi:hypothetical protein